MKPREKKPEIVYRIIDRNGNAQGSYSRACHDEYDFSSIARARNANCHGMFRSPEYRIAKYRVTYELLTEDAEGDPQSVDSFPPFITRADFDRFLTALVETDGAGGIADYRVDEMQEPRGLVRVHVRHRLRNLLRPVRRRAIEVELQNAIDYGRSAGIQVEVTGSCLPLWLRRAP